MRSKNTRFTQMKSTRQYLNQKQPKQANERQEIIGDKQD